MIATGLLLAALVASNPVAPATNLRAPAGFVVTEFADSSLANDILSMTVDPRGRIVVAGRGYIRILIDDDGDGRADRAVQFANSPRDGAQGMLWEGDSLFVSGDGGLRRFRANQDGNHAIWGAELIRAARTGGEHESHAIKRGPDGWLYWLGGNNAGVREGFAQLETSPIRNPLAGCLVRFTPDLKQTEVVADGFRNAYDFDFNRDGRIFTYDSDNERCVSLPWYEGTRFYEIVAGGHYGWLNPQRAETWRTPPYLFDVVPPLLDLGRGSPTAVVCYRGQSFPRRYQNGFFLFDWTFGRVYFTSLQKAGALYRASKEIFLESTGDDGFAPTAALVHPATGDLFIAIGGRGTRGAVYRVHFQGSEKTPTAQEQRAAPRQPDSLSLEGTDLRALVESLGSREPMAELNALRKLNRFHHHLSPAEIRAAVTTCWNSPDRSIRRETARLLGCLDMQQLSALGESIKTDAERATLVMAATAAARKIAEAEAVKLLRTGQTAEMRLVGIRVIQLLLGGQGSRRLEGTCWEGYSARLPWWLDPATVPVWRRRLPHLFQTFWRDAGKAAAPDITWEAFAARVASGLTPETLGAVREAFPSGDASLDRELSRTLAMTGDEDSGVLERVARQWSASSDPAHDVHYLLTMARLQASRTPGLTAVVAHTLLSLDRKISDRKWNRERNWYLRIGELYAELVRRDPRLPQALFADPDFGRSDHAIFAQAAGFPKEAAARRFLIRSANDPAFEWNADLILLLRDLPADEAYPAVRRLWKQGGLQEPILSVLVRQPVELDRERFLEGLSSAQVGTVRLCLEALEKLPARNSASDLLLIVQAFGRLPEERATGALRRQFVKDLENWSGQPGVGPSKEAWRRWFMKQYPALAEKVVKSDGVDREVWDRRLAQLNWTTGEAERGRAVFQQVNCASCHTGAQALGPDLRGVTNRFSRDDLFTAILQPSRDISSRYRTTQVITSDDKIYQGLIIYEAVDSLLLQTGPATTVRVVNQQIVSKRTTDVSLMPVGLLDKASDRDVADLYAYLRSLRP